MQLFCCCLSLGCAVVLLLLVVGLCGVGVVCCGVGVVCCGVVLLLLGWCGVVCLWCWGGVVLGPKSSATGSPVAIATIHLLEDNIQERVNQFCSLCVMLFFRPVIAGTGRPKDENNQWTNTCETSDMQASATNTHIHAHTQHHKTTAQHTTQHNDTTHTDATMTQHVYSPNPGVSLDLVSKLLA